MNYAELLKIYPELKEITALMPDTAKNTFRLKHFPAHSIIHQKNEHLDSFGILCKGENRIINEFANGTIYMIEKNKPISFIGEVTLLAGNLLSSVTIEAMTDCEIVYISLEDFDTWLDVDPKFLRLLTEQISVKLYNSSSVRGERQYYPTPYIVLKYLRKYCSDKKECKNGSFLIEETRQQMSESMGVTVKTLNRVLSDFYKTELIGRKKGKISISQTQLEEIKQAEKKYISENKRYIHYDKS